MKTVFEHIEHIKGKPHNIRKQIAFGTAAICTAVIALAWLVGSIGTGTFALKDTSFAQSTGERVSPTASGDDSSEQLAGIGAASALQSADAPARIEIIDSDSSASSPKKVEQTTIPF